MILEVAQVDVLPGHEEAFERDLRTAVDQVMTRADGFEEFVGHGWCIERPSIYLFTIRWQSLEHHTEGFRGSDLFAEWRSLIGPHFAGPPVVEHFGA